MDIIKRNFFKLLRSGALNKFEAIEPMSEYKWNRLFQMIYTQEVWPIALKGIKNHQYDRNMNIPKSLLQNVDRIYDNPQKENKTAQLSNFFLNMRLSKIRSNERHSIDTSIYALELLDIIVFNVNAILNNGISLRGIIDLGKYLRIKGDKVDFVKLGCWLESLHIKRMAQLEGSILITIFNFNKEEIPFVIQIEPAAKKLTIRTVNHIAIDTAKEWHFRQSRSGFVRNNSAVLRRNLRRSIRYIGFAPMETTSNFFNNFVRSLSEIEE